MFSTFMNQARISLAKRARYRSLLREIDSLTPRDLADIRADRATMIREAYRDVFG